MLRAYFGIPCLWLLVAACHSSQEAAISNMQVEGVVVCKTKFFPNTVIRGIDNWVSITVPGLSCKKLHINVSQSSFECEDCGCNIHPDPRALDSIKVEVQWKQNGRPHIATHWLMVRNVPTWPCFGGNCGEDSLLSISRAKQARGVTVGVINIGFDLRLEVTHYRMTVTNTEGEVFDGVSEDAEITEAMERALNNLHENNKLDITDIHVLLPGNVDHVVQQLHFAVIP